MARYRVEDIPENIKRIRINKGLRQMELADRMGMSPVSLSRIENGEGNLKMETVIKLADALDVEPAEIIGGSDLATVTLPRLRGLAIDRRALIVNLINEMHDLEWCEEQMSKDESIWK